MKDFKENRKFHCKSFLLSVMMSGFALLSTYVGAQAKPECLGGAYSVTQTEDGGTITILFDDFSVQAGGQTGAQTAQRTCRLRIPLQLPANMSLGVYRVDYRGYAFLSDQHRFQMEVVYGFENHPDHSFSRRINGAFDENFAFTQNIGAGLIRRVGCGESAVLDVSALISVDTRNRPGEAFALLDSLDGAPVGGLVYHFNLAPCH